MLIAIIKKRLDLKTELYTLFKKTQLDQLLKNPENKYEQGEMSKQLNLFDSTLGH